MSEHNNKLNYFSEKAILKALEVFCKTYDKRI